MLWFYHIPTWLLGVLVVSTFVLLSSLGLILTRGLAKRKIAESDNDLASYFISAVGVFYALLVGLIAVAVWESFSEVESVVTEEAISISELYRDLEGYPEAKRDQVRSLLRDYLHHVIEVEWPAQQWGEVAPDKRHLVDQIVRAWVHFEPTTEGQKAIHAECLRELNIFLGCRRERRQAVAGGLPGLLWIIVLAGAVLTVGLTYFFWTENRGLHLLLTGFLSTMVGLVVFVIIALDRPLVGEVSVPPESYREVLEMANRISAVDD